MTKIALAPDWREILKPLVALANALAPVDGNAGRTAIGVASTIFIVLGRHNDADLPDPCPLTSIL
jgi:hypothetical protein